MDMLDFVMLRTDNDETVAECRKSGGFPVYIQWWGDTIGVIEPVWRGIRRFTVDILVDEIADGMSRNGYVFGIDYRTRADAQKAVRHALERYERELQEREQLQLFAD